MEIVRFVNATLAFVLEIVMFVAYGMWGYSLNKQTIVRWPLALIVPGVVVVVWGLFAAPSASYLLKDPAHYVLELGLTLLAAFLLYRLGYQQWAITVAVLAFACQTAALFIGLV